MAFLRSPAQVKFREDVEGVNPFHRFAGGTVVVGSLPGERRKAKPHQGGGKRLIGFLAPSLFQNARQLLPGEIDGFGWLFLILPIFDEGIAGFLILGCQRPFIRKTDLDRRYRFAAIRQPDLALDGAGVGSMPRIGRFPDGPLFEVSVRAYNIPFHFCKRNRSKFCWGRGRRIDKFHAFPHRIK